MKGLNIGDKVKVISKEEVYKNWIKDQFYYFSPKYGKGSSFAFTPEAVEKYCGKVVTIVEVFKNDTYHIAEDCGGSWTEDMFESKINFLEDINNFCQSRCILKECDSSCSLIKYKGL